MGGRTVRILDVETIARNKGKLISVSYDQRRRDGEQQSRKREIYDNGNSAVILPYDSSRKTVLLTRQLRLPIFLQDGMERTVEACAGKLDGETPERRIMKEMQEELGYKVSNVQRLFELYVSPAAIMEKIVFFTCAYSPANKVSNGGGLKDEGEDIEVVETTLEEAAEMIATGEIAATSIVIPACGGPPSLQERLSAGDCDRGAGHVAGKRICQHDIGGRQFDRLARALHRNLLAEIFHGVFRKRRGNQRCPDRSRRDRIGANALFGQHLRQPCRKIVDRALGRRIGQQGGVGRIRIDRCGVDDAATRLHVAHRGLGKIEHRVDIDLEGQFPFFVTDLIDRLEAGLMRRVVDEDIDAAELRYGFGNNRPAMIGVLDVARNNNGLSACLGHQPFSLPRVVVLFQIGDQDVGSFPSKGNGNRATDAAIASRDDSLLAVESAAALVRSFTVVRQRLHRAGCTRHRLMLAREGWARIMQHCVSPK